VTFKGNTMLSFIKSSLSGMQKSKCVSNRQSVRHTNSKFNTTDRADNKHVIYNFMNTVQ